MSLLELKTKIDISYDLDLKNLNEINFSKLNKKKISDISLEYNFKKIKLSEVFNIQILTEKKNNKKIIIIGSNKFFRNIGFKWKENSLCIKGDAGSYLGHRMEGGLVEVKGSAENFVACKMTGGKIIIDETVGDYTGSADFGEKIGMNGGVVVIKKNAGNYLGNFMRRGVIIVGGHVKDNCCNNFIAGTIVINGNIGKNLATNMKRGTIITNCKKAIPHKKFINCGDQKIDFYNIFNKHFRNDLGVQSKCKNFVKYIGNTDVNGYGEILLRKSNQK